MRIRKQYFNLKISNINNQRLCLRQLVWPQTSPLCMPFTKRYVHVGTSSARARFAAFPRFGFTCTGATTMIWLVGGSCLGLAAVAEAQGRATRGETRRGDVEKGVA